MLSVSFLHNEDGKVPEEKICHPLPGFSVVTKQFDCFLPPPLNLYNGYFLLTSYSRHCTRM